MPIQSQSRVVHFTVTFLCFLALFSGVDVSAQDTQAFDEKKLNKEFFRAVCSPEFQAASQEEKTRQEESSRGYGRIVPRVNPVSVGKLDKIHLQQMLDNPEIGQSMEKAVKDFKKEVAEKMPEIRRKIARASTSPCAKNAELSRLFTDPKTRNNPAVLRLKAELPEIMDSFRAQGKKLQGSDGKSR